MGVGIDFLGIRWGSFQVENYTFLLDALHLCRGMRKISEIKNFGPKMVAWFTAAGFESESDLLECTYPEIMQRLSAVGVPFHWSIVYSLEMGLQDRPWNSIREEEKQALRAVFGG